MRQHGFLVEKPLTVEQLRGLVSKHNTITVIVPIDFDRLLTCGGIDGLNEYMDDAIFGEGGGVGLGYGFAAAGVEADSILVEVSCDVDRAELYEDELDDGAGRDCLKRLVAVDGLATAENKCY